MQPPPDLPFAVNATKCLVCDVNGDGKNDIVYTDAEASGGRVWWVENVDEEDRVWREHVIYDGSERQRLSTAYMWGILTGMRMSTCSPVRWRRCPATGHLAGTSGRTLMAGERCGGGTSS